MQTTRREFLKQASAVAVAGTATAASSPGARAAGAAAGPSEQLTVGFIGTGRQGTNLLNAFVLQPDVRVAWV